MFVKKMKSQIITGELAVNLAIAPTQDRVLKITGAEDILELVASGTSDLQVDIEEHAGDGTVHQNLVHHRVIETNINMQEKDDARGLCPGHGDHTAVHILIDLVDPKDIQKIEKCM